MKTTTSIRCEQMTVREEYGLESTLICALLLERIKNLTKMYYNKEFNKLKNYKTGTKSTTSGLWTKTDTNNT